MKWLLRNKLVILFAIFIGIYIALTLMAPANTVTAHRYHLHGAQLHRLGLTVAIPYAIIWAIALMGYLRLRTYVNIIKKSKDGTAFKTISYGVLWFALWLPASTIISTYFRNIYEVHPDVTASLTRIENYSNFLLIAPGFWLTYLGTKKLLPLVKRQLFEQAEWILFAYIAFSALYVFLTLHDSTRQLAIHGVSRATYYEPDWLVIFTITIPRLLLWFMGFIAAHNLYIYSKHVKGLLYKQALQQLTVGLAGVVVMIIVLRCIQSLSVMLNEFSLVGLLLFVYVLLILMSVGYVLVAKGAQKLQKLEEL